MLQEELDLMEIDLDQIFGFQAANYKLWSKNLFISLYPQESVFIHFPTVTLRSPSSVTLPTIASSSLTGFRLPYWASTLSSSIEWQCNNSSEELMLANLNFWSGKISCAEIAEIPLATSTNRISDGFDGERNVKQVVFWPVGHKVGVVLIMFRQSGISNDDGFLYATSWKILVKTMDFWVF